MSYYCFGGILTGCLMGSRGVLLAKGGFTDIATNLSEYPSMRCCKFLLFPLILSLLAKISP